MKLLALLAVLALAATAAAAQGIDPFSQFGLGPVTTLISRSGSIVVGGTAQTVASANANRLGFCLQPITSGPFWISLTGTAAPNNSSLNVSQYWCAPARWTGAVSIYGATTSAQFWAVEW